MSARPLALGAVLALPAPAMGGWTQEPGEVYAKVWNRTLVGRFVFRNDSLYGLATTDRTYQDHQLQAYGEVGVAEGLTAVAYVSPVGLAGYGNELGGYVGPAWAGGRVRLVQGERAVLSLQGTAGGRAPVGERRLFDGVIEGNPAFVQPTAGTGLFEGSLQVGVGLGRRWLVLHAGARGHTGDAFLPAVTGTAQLGWTLENGVSVDLHAPVYLSVGPLSELDVLGVTNTRYVGAGIGGSVPVAGRWAVTGALEGVVFASSNAATPSLNLGLELR